MQKGQAPLLCSTWTRDGTGVFFGGADNGAHWWHLERNAVKQAAKHDAPIKEMSTAMIGGKNILITGSWDKTLKYWDPTQSNPLVGTVNMPGRVYAMDVKNDALVVGCDERQVCLIDLKSPMRIFSKTESPLRYQTRTISVFIDGQGYAIGSIEGRCAIHHFNQQMQKKNFAFRCHRQPGNDNMVNPINGISFHPRYGTFATFGADGGFAYWDHGSKQRLKISKNCQEPIVAANFNRDGNLFAYATGYDWHQGRFGFKNQPNNIYIHCVKDGEIGPRPANRRQGRRR